MDENQIPHCLSCGKEVSLIDNFCPSCGVKLEHGIEHIGWGRQMYIYTISLLAPPFGLVWTFRYLKQKNPQVQWVGIIAGILTVISLGLSIWAIFGFIQTSQQLLNTNVGGYSGF